MTNLTVSALKEAIQIKERIESLEAQLTKIVGKGGIPSSLTNSQSTSGATSKRKGISAAGRARLAAAMKARWAARKKGESKPAAKAPSSKGKKVMSPAARAKIAARMKARWAEKRKAEASGDVSKK